MVKIVKSNLLPPQFNRQFQPQFQRGQRKKKKKKKDTTIWCHTSLLYINSVDKPSIQLVCHLVGHALTDAYGTMWRNLSPELAGLKACSPTWHNSSWAKYIGLSLCWGNTEQTQTMSILVRTSHSGCQLSHTHKIYVCCSFRIMKEAMGKNAFFCFALTELH